MIFKNEGLACSGPIAFECSDVFGNAGGDALCGPDLGGNFSADPLFCLVRWPDFGFSGLQNGSPCWPGNHPSGAECGRIGVEDSNPTCETRTEVKTWSAVKRAYR